MNKNKVGLEKRIFISFFIITFLLVTVIIFVEWQLVKFSINQHENSSIKKVKQDIASNQDEFAKEHLFTLIELSENPDFIAAVQENKREQVTSFLLSPNAVVYNSRKQLLAGDYWDFIGNYHSLIFANDTSGYFFATFGERPFVIFYVPIHSEEELIGFILDVKSLNITIPSQDVNISYYQYAFPFSQRTLPNELSGYRTKLEKITEEMATDMDRQQIIRLSMNHTLGIYLDYDIKNQPSIIHLIVYNRYIHSFAQRSMMFFFIVLIVLSIMMISLLGNWFSKSILSPIKTINEKMKMIADNPEMIEPLYSNYKGVLGEMANTFSSMNTALKEHSESLEEYKIISDHLGSAIFWLNLDFKVALCNPALLSILQLPSMKDIINHDLNDFLHLDESTKQQALTKNITLSNYEIKIHNKKKYIFLYMVRISSKNKEKIVGSITDVTSEVIERKAREALEIELIKSNKLAEIGRRVEGIVHNMNSPLNSVIGYAQLLKKEDSGNKDVDKILESGKVISHYVKTLQQKIKKDTMSLLHPVHLNDLVKQELQLCQHNLFFKHYINLTTDFAEHLPELYVVYGDISLCVANLLNNAIESMKKSEKKEIFVRTYKKDNSLCVQIKDTGKGIAEKNYSAIFQPYFTTKTENDAVGYGLGLAICKHVADKYDGTIKVRSELGKGSEFTLILPIKSQK